MVLMDLALFGNCRSKGKSRSVMTGFEELTMIYSPQRVPYKSVIGIPSSKIEKIDENKTRRKQTYGAKLKQGKGCLGHEMGHS
jgi:hypothetical protein